MTDEIYMPYGIPDTPFYRKMIMKYNMTERVARALHCSVNTWAAVPQEWNNLNSNQFSAFFLAAIAAIEAMREPSEAMGEAAVEDHSNHAYHMSSYHCVTEAWRNMIDAALEEK